MNTWKLDHKFKNKKEEMDVDGMSVEWKHGKELINDLSIMIKDLVCSLATISYELWFFPKRAHQTAQGPSSIN